MTTCAIPGLLALSALVAGGCTDMSTPAELSHPQILAVRADPPVVAPGGSATLSLLVAGPGGRLTPATVTWSDNVEVDRARARFLAPAEVPTDGTLVEVDVAVEVDGETLRAAKRVGVGLAGPTDNPAIEALLVAGQPVAGDAIAVPAGGTVTLDVAVSPAPSDAAIYAWYSTLGEIDLYRRSPCELIASDQAGEGTLIAVYRDGLGVDWRVVDLAVE